MAGLLCAIHQPNFLPRLSTLAKLYGADIWIILDDVQFTRRDYQHRSYLAPVASAQLPGRWLTIPIHLPDGRATLIRDVRLADPRLTAKRTSGILRHYYQRAPYRCDVLDLIPGIEETITGSGRLADVSEHTTIALLRLLNWPGAICRSSGIPARSGRSERLADLARAVGAATYLCGTGGSRYLDPAPFAALGLTVTMFTPPEHATDLSPDDVHRVSILADLATVGSERLSAAMREHAWRNHATRYPHVALQIVLRAVHVFSLGIHWKVYYHRCLRLCLRQRVPVWQVHGTELRTS
jgi:WbqC-like protein